MKTDGTTLRQAHFPKHVATARTIGGAVCPKCDTNRTEREYQDAAGRRYLHCHICRDRHPELRMVAK